MKNPLNLDIVSKYRQEIYGISILWIMFFHGFTCEVTYFQDIPGLKYVGDILLFGNIGVEMFLFLSGICMYFSYSRQQNAGMFFEKRLKRVMPAVFLICGIYWIWCVMKKSISITSCLLNLTAMKFWFTGNQQIWFISCILVCYFIYPYLYEFLFAKDKNSFFRTIFLIVMLMVFIYMLREEAPDYYKMTEIGMTRIPVFILGSYVGKYVFEKKELPAYIWILMIFSTLLCFYLLEIDIVHSFWKRYLGMLAGIPLTFLSGKVVSYLGKYVRQFFAFFGDRSLELYLSHIIFKRMYQKGQFFLPFQAGNTRNWFIILLCSVVVAFVASLLLKQIMKPGKNLKLN